MDPNNKLPLNLQDLKALNISELKDLSLELRQLLIESLSGSSAHFASSLGVVELSLALHFVFDSPNDALIWDTGHQAYIHKILTERADKISNIRTKDGISGFLKRDENIHDSFGAGHAGTSVSAAVGMAKAFSINELPNCALAIIGDGAFTSGMVFEALNHAGGMGLGNLVVVFNDNGWSISKNVGALSSGAKANGINAAGISALCEAFNFNYAGPIDGHDIEECVEVLAAVKADIVTKHNTKPTLLHFKTIKGKGYEPAEKDPVRWHAVSKGQLQTPTNLIDQSRNPSSISFTEIFGNTLTKIAKQNSKVVAISAAMDVGTGLKNFKAQLPEQFFDVGICEQHALTFAAGLACQGLKPVCAIYSTFLQRAFDQILHDVCIQNLPVVFAIDRAGAVGADGETHQGLFDIGFLRFIPNLILMSPKDGNELEQMLFTAINLNCPVALRYPKTEVKDFIPSQNFTELKVGQAEELNTGNDATIFAFGPLAMRALALSKAAKEIYNLNIGVVNARFAKPLDTNCLKEIAKRTKLLVSLEDHSLIGGFGAAIAETLSDLSLSHQSLLRLGFQDRFLVQGTQDQQHELNGLDLDSALNAIVDRLKALQVPSRYSTNHRLDDHLRAYFL